mmetsp:Transcript_28006/g.80321  ORF Transcript_28006/g.80321 Transcript_28006/m.80321 type:complete len:234 (+) Transcript_28006:1390-2091(+)
MQAQVDALDQGLRRCALDVREGRRASILEALQGARGGSAGEAPVDILVGGPEANEDHTLHVLAEDLTDLGRASLPIELLLVDKGAQGATQSRIDNASHLSQVQRPGVLLRAGRLAFQEQHQGASVLPRLRKLDLRADVRAEQDLRWEILCCADGRGMACYRRGRLESERRRRRRKGGRRPGPSPPNRSRCASGDSRRGSGALSRQPPSDAEAPPSRPCSARSGRRHKAGRARQ